MIVESGNMKQWYATAQAVSHWLLAVVASIQFQVRHVECVADHVELEQVSSKYFSFPCQVGISYILCGW
jgi:hypothetical protein